MANNTTIKVSVTRLAEFACRQGDLIPDMAIGPSAKDGIRVHKALQKKRKQAVGDAEWLNSEVPLKHEFTIDGYTLQVGGRVDLIDSRKHCLTEIKTTLVPSDRLPESQRALQWAQLMLYAYLYTHHNEAESSPPELELVHVNIRGEQARETSEIRQPDSLEIQEHAVQAMSFYVQWIAKVRQWRENMNDSAGALDFPFKQFRKGQRDMAAAVYRACRDSKPVMCEAPTGIGKTVSALYPAIKSMGEGKLHQLVYLTAKVAGRQSAEKAIEKLCCAGLQATAIQIRAKEQTCFCSNGRCGCNDAGQCPMTLGFHDRLPAAREELLALGVISNEKLDEVAWDHQLCPFELVQQLLPWVQIVVADYNYVFDPLVCLPHFSGACNGSVLLIDEAHNLLDRSRWMFSAQLSRQECRQAADECRSENPLLAKELDALCSALLKQAKIFDKSEGGVGTRAPVSVSKAVGKVLVQIGEANDVQGIVAESVSAIWKALCRYAVIDELFADHHRCIVTSSKRGRTRDVSVTLFCVDASLALDKRHGQFSASVVFSATLRPGSFYRDTLGLPEDTGYLQLQTPFEAKRCYRAVVEWIDTRYRQREDSLPELACLIYESASLQSGSYMVFLPSYAYLEQLHKYFVNEYPDCGTWVQSREQSREDREALFQNLDTPGHRIGFAILGGVFGEGMDYVGDRLIGSFIVGTGLSPIDQKTELIANHYKELGCNAYDFAYRYPGFTRVLQTAGRVIRDEADKGFVLLVDFRFRQPVYRKLFPADWELQYPLNKSELLATISKFWKA